METIWKQVQSFDLESDRKKMFGSKLKWEQLKLHNWGEPSNAVGWSPESSFLQKFVRRLHHTNEILKKKQI